MAAIDDLASIQFLCQKAINITRTAVTGTILVDPNNDREGETQITLTPAQQAAVFARRAAILSQIKTLAAGLPAA